MNIIKCYIEYNPADGEIIEVELYGSPPSGFANYITLDVEEYVFDVADTYLRKKVDINADPKVLIDKYTQEEIDAAAFSDAQTAKKKAINERTKELIFEGFAFDGQIFSLSENAQLSWLAMKAAAELLIYPEEISTKDDLEYELTEANSTAFFATALSVAKGHKSSGRALRKQVRQATTYPELDAVVDNR